MTWAQKRKLTYALIFFGVVAIFIGVPAYLLLYKAPTCFDNKRNQNEQGIDCGGPCIKLCSPIERQPVVVWQQTFEVTPGVFTAAAYIQNPNIDAEAKSVPYTFSFYDTTNTLIITKTGTTYIPAGKNFAVVETNVDMLGKRPVRTLFEFGNEFIWTRAPRNQPDIEVKNQTLTDASTTPTVTATVSNSTFTNIPTADVAAIVYNTEGNAFAASKTFVKNLDGRTSQPVVFTWPSSFPYNNTICKATSDIVLSIDRSGSMSSDGTNPPEPLTSVKNAAASFVRQLEAGDQSALISFATTPTIDQSLTSDFTSLTNAITQVAIRTGTTQYTNVADTLLKAINELGSERHHGDSKKVVVLLTDGIANYPTKKGDEKYAATYAEKVASDAKSLDIEIFTIGLGHDLDETFLKNIASGSNHYFNAATSGDLKEVYGKVAQALCKKQAVRVEIIPTIPLK